jgi:hypothetical protein
VAACGIGYISRAVPKMTGTYGAKTGSCSALSLRTPPEEHYRHLHPTASERDLARAALAQYLGREVPSEVAPPEAKVLGQERWASSSLSIVLSDETPIQHLVGLRVALSDARRAYADAKDAFTALQFVPVQDVPSALPYLLVPPRD